MFRYLRKRRVAISIDMLEVKIQLNKELFVTIYLDLPVDINAFSES